jgi:hypothetical protein
MCTVVNEYGSNDSCKTVKVKVVRRVEKKERPVVSKRTVQLSELRAEHKIGYTRGTRSFAVTKTSVSGMVEKFMEWCFGNIYQTGQGVGVIMQESFLLTGIEFQYMCLAFRSQ